MNNTVKLLSLAVAATLFVGCSDNDNDNNEDVTPEPPVVAKADWTKTNEWFEAGEETVMSASQVTEMLEKGAAKNVILFVGDGMGVSTVTAGRIYVGQQMGQMGEDYQLSFEHFPVAGFAKTYNTNQQTPDSAGTMTAMMSGVKTKAGVIGISETADRANCASTSGQELVTAVELAEMIGKSTGVVSTARITHATPAATYSKSPERNWESDNNLTAEAIANGCTDIAAQLIEFSHGDGIDVVMGGGRRQFLPETITDEEGSAGKRTDGRNLVNEWQTANPSGYYVYDQVGFDSVNAETTDKLFGLFNASHMEYEADRANDVAGEPSLTEMTQKSIDILSKNDKGFMLVVESGRIDHAHHGGNAARALEDTAELNRAVQAAVDSVDLSETLIIVTADHSHVFTIAGYPQRGNPILGLVKSTDSSGAPSEEETLALDGMPYTTLGYQNGLAHADGITRHSLTEEQVTDLDYNQESLVLMYAETHAGEDVGIYAIGPGAQLLRGTHEQSDIFHAINHAADLVGGAEAASVTY